MLKITRHPIFITIVAGLMFFPIFAKAQTYDYGYDYPGADYGYSEPSYYVDYSYPGYDSGSYYYDYSYTVPVDPAYQYVPDSYAPSANYDFHSPVDPNYHYTPDPSPSVTPYQFHSPVDPNYHYTPDPTPPQTPYQAPSPAPYTYYPNTYYPSSYSYSYPVYQSSSYVYIPPAPNVSLSLSPSSAPAGTSVLLSWFSTGTSICTASGGWSGVKSTSGSETVTPSANTTYSISCSSTQGQIYESKTFTVAAVPVVATAVTSVRQAVARTVPRRTIARRVTKPAGLAMAGWCDLNQCLTETNFDSASLATAPVTPGIGHRLLAAIFIGKNGDLSFLAYIFSTLFLIMFGIILYLIRKMNKQKQITVAL